MALVHIFLQEIAIAVFLTYSFPNVRLLLIVLDVHSLIVAILELENAKHVINGLMCLYNLPFSPFITRLAFSTCLCDMVV